MDVLQGQIEQSQSLVSSVFGSLTSQLDNLQSLQKALLGDFADFSALVYGLGLAVLTWVMTSFQITARARLPCLVTILVGVAMERQVSYLEKVFGYNGLIFWCRTLVLLVLLWHLR